MPTTTVNFYLLMENGQRLLLENKVGRFIIGQITVDVVGKVEVGPEPGPPGQDQNPGAL